MKEEDNNSLHLHRLALWEGESKAAQISQCIVARFGTVDLAHEALTEVAMRYMEGAISKSLRARYPPAPRRADRVTAARSAPAARDAPVARAPLVTGGFPL